MPATIKADDLARLRCQVCGEKPVLTQITAKKGVIYRAECRCKVRALWVEKDDYQEWHARTHGYVRGEK